MLKLWKDKAKLLKREVYTLWIAYRKPGLPWYARVFAALVVAYAFSPIDIIPDFIPVLGYLDDLILIPLGVSLAIKMIPREILLTAREEANIRLEENHQANWIAGGMILLLWLSVFGWVIWRLLR